MPIADFTSAERWIVQTPCNERWHRDAVELHPADMGLKLDPDSDELIDCPALFRQVGDCSFVIIKTGGVRFRCHILYQHKLEQYGTSVAGSDDIGECAVTLLRIRADHQSVRSGAYPDRRPGD